MARESKKRLLLEPGSSTLNQISRFKTGMKRPTLLLFIIDGGIYADSTAAIPDGKAGLKLSYQNKIEGASRHIPSR
jgi:hypothetical protein